MWHWDQGRLNYFQFDALKRISHFVISNDFKAVAQTTVSEGTGLPFRAPETHSPWRNYSRVLKLSLLVSEENSIAQATPIAHILATAGLVTCDEYLHFLIQASSEPSPALNGWNKDADFRYPLLFAIKYMLAKTASGDESPTELDEIIGAYQYSSFIGNESDEEYLQLLANKNHYEDAILDVPDNLKRQARESIRVISQISYLHSDGKKMIVSLAKEDAQEIFTELNPIAGDREEDADAEIRRLAEFFKEGSTSDIFEFSNTKPSETVESGFREGSKVKKTHVTIERNNKLRKLFFKNNPTARCDVCEIDTAQKYPWTERVLDVHHLLPLSSGTRTKSQGTTLEDLVAVCPSCHRAIHRYYDNWLRNAQKADFSSVQEAQDVYNEIKRAFAEE